MKSPFDDPETYDLLFETLGFDIEYYKTVAREGGGPVLDLACGTGRVGMRLLDDGADVDGVDLFRPMLDHFRKKAAAAGHNVNLYEGDLKQFKTPRKYKRIICAFNAFAHNLTTADQISCLRSVRDHLLPGGAFICHMSYPVPELWAGTDGVPVLEAELQLGDGRAIRIYDSRTKNRTEQTQHSEMEIQILDSAGNVIKRDLSETDVRWIYKPEFELLLKMAEFGKVNIYGDFERTPAARNIEQMIVEAYR